MILYFKIKIYASTLFFRMRIMIYEIPDIFKIPQPKKRPNPSNKNKRKTMAEYIKKFNIIIFECN